MGTGANLGDLTRFQINVGLPNQGTPYRVPPFYKGGCGGGVILIKRPPLLKGVIMTISHNGFPSCLHIFGHVTRCFPAMHSEMLGVPLMHLQYINNLAYLGDFIYNFWICFCRSPKFFLYNAANNFFQEKKIRSQALF